jgi:hypothetical protein
LVKVKIEEEELPDFSAVGLPKEPNQRWKGQSAVKRLLPAEFNLTIGWVEDSDYELPPPSRSRLERNEVTQTISIVCGRYTMYLPFSYENALNRLIADRSGSLEDLTLPDWIVIASQLMSLAAIRAEERADARAKEKAEAEARAKAEQEARRQAEEMAAKARAEAEAAAKKA